MSEIRRLDVGPRACRAVIHGDTVYLGGQVAENALGASVVEQTREILARIEQLLAEAGSDKSRLLFATVWLADINDYAEMNKVWDAWVAQGSTPGRACVQAKLAFSNLKVEIAAVAAR